VEATGKVTPLVSLNPLLSVAVRIISHAYVPPMIRHLQKSPSRPSPVQRMHMES